MSFFGNFTFFLVLIPGLIPAIILGLLEKPIKVYSFFLSLVLIFLVLRTEPMQLFYLAAFFIAEVFAIEIYLVLRKKYGRNPGLYWLFIIFAILPLLLSKFTWLCGSHIFVFVGVAYLTLKVVQVIIEIYDGVIKDIRLFDLSLFLLFFPSLSSGPIDRSRRFAQDLHTTCSRGEYLKLLGAGLRKILIGAVYRFVIAVFIYRYMIQVADRIQPLCVIAYAYTYGINMFFDFAGYSLMAVGTSYILGIRTPDNFNYPFISVDLKDFWNRWHISLSHWLRDFVFSRFMIRSIKKKWFKNRLNGAAVGFIVNMLIMGLWHGIWNYYILYGLYHGVLLALTEVYQKKSKFYARNKQKKTYKMVSWFVTMNAVMFGFLIFSGEFNEVVHAVIRALF